MYTDDSYLLPDPVMQSEFYRDTPVKRLFAWFVDTAISIALMVPALFMTAFTGLLFLPFLFFVVGFAYRVLTLATGSATWGMRFMSLEMRDAQGQRFDLGTAFMHTLGYTVSMAITPLQIVSIVLMFTSERKQGLTDLGLGTVALNRRAS